MASFAEGRAKDIWRKQDFLHQRELRQAAPFFSQRGNEEQDKHGDNKAEQGQ